MIKLLALCTDPAVFQKNLIFNDDVARRYPGALWAPEFRRIAVSRGFEVVTGDIALARLKAAEIRAEDISVVQEERAKHGVELIRAGAKPLILFCLESPMFARRFYSQLSAPEEKFKHRVLFSGAFDMTGAGGNNHPAYFPSFDGQVRSPADWSARDFLVLVAGNKFYKEPKRPSGPWKWAKAVRRNLLDRKDRRIAALVEASQLHEERLAVVEYFGKRRLLRLYGAGWDDLGNLPEQWQERLKPIVEALTPTLCDDKLQTVGRFKFAICFENMRFPGYVTEKIIDCMVASTIPIYYGCQDISDFVDAKCFVDYNKFSNLFDLERHMSKMSLDEASAMLEAARIFLRSPRGIRFSYRSFAENVLQLATS